ncbi:MAG: type II toxin-antitoxin system Phd/YefM family antitoxin [Caulobacteraceae bacterium]|nr:type II toxin-antitoxin system Phd/YefM family antitoxin [Caulobacter sp.]
MVQANIHEAKTQLSRLIERAEAGEEVVIARHGKPVVRLMPLHADASTRPGVFGALRGKVEFGADYETADAEVAALFFRDEAAA